MSEPNVEEIVARLAKRPAYYWDVGDIDDLLADWCKKKEALEATQKALQIEIEMRPQWAEAMREKCESIAAYQADQGSIPALRITARIAALKGSTK